jgi:hypothetical protein
MTHGNIQIEGIEHNQIAGISLLMNLIDTTNSAESVSASHPVVATNSAESVFRKRRQLPPRY